MPVSPSKAVAFYTIATCSVVIFSISSKANTVALDERQIKPADGSYAGFDGSSESTAALYYSY